MIHTTPLNHERNRQYWEKNLAHAENAKEVCLRHLGGLATHRYGQLQLFTPPEPIKGNVVELRPPVTPGVA